MTKTYTLEFTIEARDEESLPQCEALAISLAGALPDAWWHLDEGDPYAIRVLGCTKTSSGDTGATR